MNSDLLWCGCFESLTLPLDNKSPHLFWYKNKDIIELMKLKGSSEFNSSLFMLRRNKLLDNDTEISYKFMLLFMHGYTGKGELSVSLYRCEGSSVMCHFCHFGGQSGTRNDFGSLLPEVERCKERAKGQLSPGAESLCSLSCLKRVLFFSHCFSPLRHSFLCVFAEVASG